MLVENRTDLVICFRFSAAHNFAKPNDAAALELMNCAARQVCSELRGDVVMAFGESDEYR